MGVIAKQTENEFAGIPIPDFIDIILNNRDGRADEAMYCLLHQCIIRQLRQRFEDYQHQLLDSFDDVIEDFFFYLREGNEGEKQSPYVVLRSVNKKDSFESWILNTFRNYLSVRATKEGRVTHTEPLAESVADVETFSSELTDEQKLSVASNLIAYGHQKLSSRDGFIFYQMKLWLKHLG